MIKFRILLLVFFFSLSHLYCQSTDFGMWYSVGTSIKVVKKFELSLGSTLRTTNNASKLDQFFFDGTAGYKINKYIAVSASYRHIFKSEKQAGIFNRYRYNTDVKFSYPFLNFKFSSRFRFQGQYKQYIENSADKLPEYYFRIKPQIYYNWPFSRFNPFLAFEWFFPESSKYVRYVDQKRVSLGLECKISKKQTLEMEYIFQRDYSKIYSNIDILSFSYNYEF